MEQPGSYQTRDLCKLTGLSRMSVSRRASAGNIPGAYRKGARGKWEFPASLQLSAWIDARKASADVRENFRAIRARIFPVRDRLPRKTRRAFAAENGFSDFMELLAGLVAKAKRDSAYHLKSFPFLLCQEIRLQQWQKEIKKLLDEIRPLTFVPDIPDNLVTKLKGRQKA